MKCKHCEKTYTLDDEAARAGADRDYCCNKCRTADGRLRCRGCGANYVPNSKLPIVTEKKSGLVTPPDPDDPDYCSGKCRAQDGRGQLGQPEQEPEQVGALCATEIESLAVQAKTVPGSLDDYLMRPDAYRRRYQPERLNWGEKLAPKELTQAGLRGNRIPIPGDWDFEEKEAENAPH